MQKMIRKYREHTKLETIHKYQEFLFGPYPYDDFYTTGTQWVSSWAEHIFLCWFDGREDMCAWRV
jgi:hypothetical protein